MDLDIWQYFMIINDDFIGSRTNFDRVSHDQNQSISQLPIRTMENMRRNPSTIKIETSLLLISRKGAIGHSAIVFGVLFLVQRRWRKFSSPITEHGVSFLDQSQSIAWVLLLNQSWSVARVFQT